MCCLNILQWRWWFCVDLRSPNGWRIGPKRTGRTFDCCLRVRLNLNMSVIFNAVWGCNFTLIMWCPNTLQWRWRLYDDLCLSNILNVCLVGAKRAARTLVLLCVRYEFFTIHARIWLCYWWLMKYEVVISPLHTLQCRLRLCVDHRSINVWNGCCVAPKPTVRMFVLLRVLAFGTYYCCSMKYEVAI